MKIFKRIFRLWAYGIFLLFLYWCVAFIACLPIYPLSLAHIKPGVFLVAVILFIYLPIATAWTIEKVLLIRPMRSLLVNIAGSTDEFPHPIVFPRRIFISLYFAIFALLNMGIAVGFTHFCKFAVRVYTEILQDPSAIPPIAAWAVECFWWPWLFVCAGVVAAFLNISGKLSERSVIHIFAALWLVEIGLLLASFYAFWVPLVTIFLKLSI